MNKLYFLTLVLFTALLDCKSQTIETKWPSPGDAEKINVLDNKRYYDEVLDVTAVVDSLKIIRVTFPDVSDYLIEGWKVTLDEDRLFVPLNNKLCVYDLTGHLLFELKGRSSFPGGMEIGKSNFFIDTNKNEIWMSQKVDDPFLIYSYTGELRRKEESKAIILPGKEDPMYRVYSDFIATDNAMFFATQKSVFHNGNNDNEFIKDDLFVVNKDGGTISYFPVDKKIPKDDYGNDTNHFSVLNGSFTFHFLNTDTIYSIDRSNGQVRAKYIIDYGENGLDKDVSKLSNNEFMAYIYNSGVKFGLTRNVVETDNYLLFQYACNNGSDFKTLLYDANSHRIMAKGLLSVGLFKTRLAFEPAKGQNKKIVLVAISDDNGLELSDKGSNYLSEKNKQTIKEIKKGDIIVLTGMISDTLY